MKYVITDMGEARIGSGYHVDLAFSLEGKVVAAGHCELMNDGNYRVWGSSIGYQIRSMPEDAQTLKEIFNV